MKGDTELGVGQVLTSADICLPLTLATMGVSVSDSVFILHCGLTVAEGSALVSGAHLIRADTTHCLCALSLRSVVLL